MKLQEVEVKKLGQQMVDFVDDVRDLTNNGKFAHPIVGLVPAWTADNGEMVFFDAGEATTDRRIYVRLSSSWVLFAQISGSGAPSNPGGSEGAVQFNSGGIFGGDAEYLWDTSNGNTLLKLTGGMIITNTNPTVALFTVRDKNIGFPHIFQVSSSGNISVYAGSPGVNANGVVALGPGTQPQSRNSTVQIWGDGGTTDLYVLPEQGHPHILGHPLVVLSDAALVVRDLDSTNGTGLLQLEGGVSTTVPSQISFLRRGASAFTLGNIFWSTNSSSGSQFRPGPSITIGPSNHGQEYFLFADQIPQLALTRENPHVIVGISTNGAGIQGAHYHWQSGNNIVNQRNVVLLGPRLHGSVAAGGASVTTISNAATLYIESAPTVITVGSLNVINTYALWVNGGDVRLDGALIVGGSTITPTPFVVNTRALFTTTGLGVASNNAGEITLLRGVVGTTSLIANTFSDGRTIRLSALGYFNTPLVVDNLTMRVKIGGQTVLTTGAQTPAASASTLGWKLDTLITCQTTGGAGTVIGQGDSEFHSSLVAKDFWQMVNSSTVVINTTGANAIEITAQWSGVSSASQLFLTNAMGELLN